MARSNTMITLKNNHSDNNNANPYNNRPSSSMKSSEHNNNNKDTINKCNSMSQFSSVHDKQLKKASYLDNKKYIFMTEQRKQALY